MQRGTIIAQDTGELVTTGRKAKRKDSDVESVASKGTHALVMVLTAASKGLTVHSIWLQGTTRIRALSLMPTVGTAQATAMADRRAEATRRA